MSSNSVQPLNIPAGLVEKYAGSYPRYTSYPTALQLHEGYKNSEYKKQCIRSNQALIPRDLSIYVHIPFCHSLCYFCGCNKIVTQKENPKVSAYLNSLLSEIEQRASLIDHDRSVSQIHFGGGTPNFLATSDLDAILRKISSSFRLKSDDELEIGIEIDPRCIETEQIHELSGSGFNRFSIGVQDFSKEVQVAINRVQSERDTLEIINAAQKVSCSTNIDLITGLPRQSLSSFQSTLSKVINTGVGRISAYNFAYLPAQIKAQKLIEGRQLPSLEERIRIVQHSRNTLLSHGYTHIGVDHYVRPDDSLSKAYRNGTLQRNFQGYTTHKHTDLIGIGVSAISQFRGSISQNTSNLSTYHSNVEERKLPIEKGLNLSHDDRIRAHVIQGIMCHNHIDLSQKIRHICEGFGNQSLSDYFANVIPNLCQFEDEGLIRVMDQAIEFTPMGQFFRRQIALEFDAYHCVGQSTSQTETQNIIRFSQAL